MTAAERRVAEREGIIMSLITHCERMSAHPMLAYITGQQAMSAMAAGLTEGLDEFITRSNV